MHRGRIRALGTPAQLKAELADRRAESAEAGAADGPAPTLEDVFRHFAGSGLTDDQAGGEFRDVRNTRRTASRVG
jgi:ABC-2 type transport system ATP-binding protein